MRGKCEREKDEGWMDASISSCNLRYLTGCQVGFRFSGFPKGISGAGFSFLEVSGGISGGFQVLRISGGNSNGFRILRVLGGISGGWFSCQGGFRLLGWASGCQGFRVVLRVSGCQRISYCQVQVVTVVTVYRGLLCKCSGDVRRVSVFQVGCQVARLPDWALGC